MLFWQLLLGTCNKKKASKTTFVRKFLRKMLMKLTPGFFLNRSFWTLARLLTMINFITKSVPLPFVVAVVVVVLGDDGLNNDSVVGRGWW
jgi:hypothetical protein